MADIAIPLLGFNPLRVYAALGGTGVAHTLARFYCLWVNWKTSEYLCRVLPPVAEIVIPLLGFNPLWVYTALDGAGIVHTCARFCCLRVNCNTSDYLCLALLLAGEIAIPLLGFNPLWVYVALGGA